MDNSISKPNSKWLVLKHRLKILLRYVAIVVIIGMGIFIYWKYFMTYSDGYRAGVLQKFSHKGTIFKTYEGVIILSSTASNRNVALASEKFHFSVTSQKIANQLDTIQGQKVMVHYQQKNGVLFWKGDSNFMVDSIKLIP